MPNVEAPDGCVPEGGALVDQSIGVFTPSDEVGNSGWTDDVDHVSELAEAQGGDFPSAVWDFTCFWSQFSLTRYVSIRMGRIRWSNSLFLIGTLVLALTAAPTYLWYFGVSTTQVVLFLFFFAATGLSITLGYHRLYSHLSFKASWPVRLLTLLFGAAAFENSALMWAADHRRHHRFVDHDEDPYDISKGFFHAHIGWILFRYPPDTSLVWAKDLQRDRLVVWQHRYYVPLAVLVGFILPAFLGWVAEGLVGALGGFLLGGVTRTVLVHHMTFFINSLCHTIGRQPFSSRCTARDSALMAWLTFGEGYHNFHHEFQHDYRNGVRPWDFDPTKWCIWLLCQLRLVRQLRRVPYEKILLARIAEQERQLSAALSATETPVPDHVQQLLQAARSFLRQTATRWEERKTEYQHIMEAGMDASRDKLFQLRQDVRKEGKRFREAVHAWRHARRLVEMHLS